MHTPLISDSTKTEDGILLRKWPRIIAQNRRKKDNKKKERGELVRGRVCFIQWFDIQILFYFHSKQDFLQDTKKVEVKERQWQQSPLSITCCCLSCWGLSGGSPTLANLGNDHGFIRNTSSLVWGLWGKPKAMPRELMLKVDNIIPLWRVVIPNMKSEPSPKLSDVNRILKCRTRIVSLEGVVN